VIALAESTAPLRPSPLFFQGQASVPLVEAVTARALDLKDGQIVQATVQPQGEQMALMLRGRQIGVPRAHGWEVGQRLSFQVQAHADGSVSLQLLGPGARAPFPLASPSAAPTVAVATPYAPDISPRSPASAAQAAAPAIATPHTPATTAITAIALAGMGGASAATGAPFAGFAGVFSRLGSLLYRAPGMPDVRHLFEPGEGLDAVLAKISSSPTASAASSLQPGQVQNQAQLQTQWQAMRLNAEQLTPEAIRLAVLSAMGSETSMGRIRSPAPLDPKQLLHQLLKALQDAGDEDSPEVQQLKRALGDLDAAQLGAVQAQGNGAMAWSVVLPFFNQAPVELRFERQAQEAGQEPVYTVSAHSKSQDYGELWLKADLHGETALDLSMWALRDSVVALAQQGCEALRHSLREVGLSMRSFQAHAGARPQGPAAVQAQALPGAVLDFRV
jgi:hypothetical protein